MFHRGEGAGQCQDTPTFLSAVPQDAYHKAEDDYLAQLTAYTKKQFQVWPCTRLSHSHNAIVSINKHIRRLQAKVLKYSSVIGDLDVL